jgi:hypothetical protein
MAESPWRPALRLTIPVAAPYPEIARDLAVKFAEYVGAPPGAATGALASIAAALEAADGQRRSIDFLFTASDDGIVVTVASTD